MERKSIGKFILELRRARGLTQKELGEKLFVSDKTVSRWERDECEPELSLIPALADIFSITTDELLRRERKESRPTPSSKEEEKGLSDKQFKLMLHNHKKRFSNLSLISIGLALGGLLVAAICNLCISRGALGFGLGCLFFIAAVICQICFTTNCSLLIDEDESERIEELKAANTKAVLTTVKILFGIWLLFAFCLPIAVLTLSYYDSYYGLRINSWLLFGALFALIAFLLGITLYKLWIIKLLIKKQLIWLREEEKAVMQANERLFKKIFKVFLAVFLCLTVALITVSIIDEEMGFVKKERFDSAEQFIERAQADYDQWLSETFLIPDATATDRPYSKQGELEGKSFYYNPDLYYMFRPEHYYFITKEAYSNAQEIAQTLAICLFSAHFVNLGVCATWYFFKSTKKDNSEEL